LAETDGKPAEARDLLRQAHVAAPDEPLITFDLARVASKSSKADDADVRDFLAATPNTKDAKLLRAKILKQQGDLAGARESMVEYHGDASGLAVSMTDGGGGKSIMSGRVRVGAQYDSNVTVLPDEGLLVVVDDSGGREKLAGIDGARALVLGSVEARPKLGPGELVVGLNAQTGPHVYNSEKLERYNATSFGAMGGYNVKLAGLDTSLQLNATQVFVDTVSERYMASYAARLEALYPTSGLAMGVYAAFGLRDFFVEGDEDQDSDRDGPIVSGGFKARGKLGTVPVVALVGYQREQTEGDAQREGGLVVRLGSNQRMGPLGVALNVGWEQRIYSEVQSNPDFAEGIPAEDQDLLARRDDRLTAGAGLTLELNDMLSLVTSYAYIRNNSSAKQYTYNRHLVQGGVEARW
jgi:hypothetical protein